MPEIRIAKVKFYNRDKGFGFIKSEGEDYFFHVSDLQDQEYLPQAEDKVKFTLVTGKRGIKAGFVEHC